MPPPHPHALCHPSPCAGRSIPPGGRCRRWTQWQKPSQVDCPAVDEDSCGVLQLQGGGEGGSHSACREGITHTHIHFVSETNEPTTRGPMWTGRSTTGHGHGAKVSKRLVRPIKTRTETFFEARRLSAVEQCWGCPALARAHTRCINPNTRPEPKITGKARARDIWTSRQAIHTRRKQSCRLGAFLQYSAQGGNPLVSTQWPLAALLEQRPGLKTGYGSGEPWADW